MKEQSERLQPQVTKSMRLLKTRHNLSIVRSNNFKIYRDEKELEQMLTKNHRLIRSLIREKEVKALYEKPKTRALPKRVLDFSKPIQDIVVEWTTEGIANILRERQIQQLKIGYEVCRRELLSQVRRQTSVKQSSKWLKRLR